MSVFMAMLGLMAFGKLGARSNKTTVLVGTPTGDGTMDFSIPTGDDTALLALLEDI